MSAAVERVVSLLHQHFPGRDDLYLTERGSEAAWIYEPVSDDLLAAHVEGRERIGIAVDPERASFVCGDFDGKKSGPGGRALAFDQASKFAEVLDADLGLTPLMEISRSGSGYHVWLLFDADDAPTLDEARQITKYALRLAGLPDDGNESKGHPGIFPHPPGGKGIGRAPFLPWGGLLNGKSGGLFVDAEGVPVERQETALEDAEHVTRSRLLDAIRTAEESLSETARAEPPAEAPPVEVQDNTSEPLDWTGVPKDSDGHETLKRLVARLRNLHPRNEALAIAWAIVCRWNSSGQRARIIPSEEVRGVVDWWYNREPFQVPTEYDRAQGSADLTIDAPTDLHGEGVVPERPEFIVPSLFRRYGLALPWGSPGVSKTHTAVYIGHEMLLAGATDEPRRLFGHPKLRIDHAPERVLMLTTEENLGQLRDIADKVLAGIGLDRPELPRGTFLHLYAHQKNGRRLTIDDLPKIIERDGPFGMITLDSLTGLRPRIPGVKWDVDNDAANALLLDLRALAEHQRVLINVLHHSDKAGNNYRGPTDWWASVDTMFGFQKVKEQPGTITVWPQKTRGGPELSKFNIDCEWQDGAVKFSYAGNTGSALRLDTVHQKLIGALEANGTTRQADLAARLGLAPETCRRKLWELQDVGRVECGEAVKRSPTWTAVIEALVSSQVTKE